MGDDATHRRALDMRNRVYRLQQEADREYAAAAACTCSISWKRISAPPIN